MFIMTTEYFYCKELTFKAHQSFHIYFTSTKICLSTKFHFHRLLEFYDEKKRGGSTMFAGHKAHFKSSTTVKPLSLQTGKPLKGSIK